MTLHGIELDDTGHPAWFRFGALRILECLLAVGAKPQDPPKWVRRWWTRDFWTVVKKLQDTRTKFDRAAGKTAGCRSAVQIRVEREARGAVGVASADDSGWEALTALNDLPLYLDLLLFYLRIQADALAAVVPYLYEHGERSISSHSFGEQRKWFIEKKPGFDPAYAQILADHTHWFEKLAGNDPLGLRDAIVHHGATYQLGWTVSSEINVFKLQAGLRNAGGWITDDVVDALKSMTYGWCEFLDAWCRHFTMKLSPVVSWIDLGQDNLARYASC